MVSTRSRRAVLVLAVAVGLLCAAVLAGGSRGEEAQAAAAGPAGEIEIGDLGLLRPITKSNLKLTASDTTGGTGGGSGRATFEPVMVQRPIDSFSPALMEAAATGRHLTDVTVRVNYPGTTKLVVTYDLKNVVVTSFEQSGTAERFALSYRSIEMTVRRESACFDLVQNVAC